MLKYWPTYITVAFKVLSSDCSHSDLEKMLRKVDGMMKDIDLVKDDKPYEGSEHVSGLKKKLYLFPN